MQEITAYKSKDQKKIFNTKEECLEYEREISFEEWYYYINDKTGLGVNSLSFPDSTFASCSLVKDWLLKHKQKVLELLNVTPEPKTNNCQKCPPNKEKTCHNYSDVRSNCQGYNGGEGYSRFSEDKFQNVDSEKNIIPNTVQHLCNTCSAVGRDACLEHEKTQNGSGDIVSCSGFSKRVDPQGIKDRVCDQCENKDINCKFWPVKTQESCEGFKQKPPANDKEPYICDNCLSHDKCKQSGMLLLPGQNNCKSFKSATNFEGNIPNACKVCVKKDSYCPQDFKKRNFFVNSKDCGHFEKEPQGKVQSLCVRCEKYVAHINKCTDDRGYKKDFTSNNSLVNCSGYVFKV
jgi:hypothetical protein